MQTPLRSVHTLPGADPASRPEARTEAPDSLFLSDAWRQACIEQWRGKAEFDEVIITPARNGAKPSVPVTALIGRRTERRHKFLPVRVLALNQSVCPVLDQPWIERNGFFGGRPAQFEAHLATLLDRLVDDRSWDELRLGGLVSDHARAALYQAARVGLASRLDLEQPTFHIDLDEIRTRWDGDYLRALSSNTRQQLRRSQRSVESTLGPLRLDQARSVEEALTWLDQTGPLHRARWGSPDGSTFASGFDNPAFTAFHRSLIARAFPSAGIQFLRLTAGDHPIAYLYNFVSGRRVHFYLSGIDYSLNQQFRPGMLAHWFAIEANIAAGRGLYDFLAGDARYKRSLATGQDSTLWLVLQRPRLKLQMEGWARRVKRSWLGIRHDDLRRIPHPSSVR